MKVDTEILRMLMDAYIVHDYCDEYGEPGYSADGPIILGDLWCRSKTCSYVKNNPDEVYADGTPKLHSVEYHYPRLFAQMEEQGIVFEWHDEWVVSHESSPSKCYRTTGDSYQWQSSILWTDGDFLTPDDDIEYWIEEVVNDPRRCLPRHVWSNEQIEELGFVEHECGFQNGWFEGMNDDPVKISEELRSREGKDIDILFKLSYVSQFDLGFCVFIRKPQQEEENDG